MWNNNKKSNDIILKMNWDNLFNVYNAIPPNDERQLSISSQMVLTFISRRWREPIIL